MNRRIRLNYSIETFDSKDYLAYAYYLHNMPKILHENDDNTFALFFKLAKIAGLEKLVEESLQKIIKKMETKKCLHKIAEDDSKKSPSYDECVYFDNTNIPYKYEEDKFVDRSIRIDEVKITESVINLYRVHIFYSSFDFNAFVGEIFFNIKPGHKEIDEKYLDKIHDISKVKFLTDSLDLSKQEAEYLLILFRMSNDGPLNDVFRYYDNIDRVFLKILDIPACELRKMLAADGKLRSYGFVDNEIRLDADMAQSIKEGSINPFFNEYLKQIDCHKAFKSESFSIPQDKTDIMKSLLTNQDNVSILLYGMPGSGKTEYARMLANQKSKKVYMFRNECESDRSSNPLQRLNCFLNIKQNDSIIIVDEADTLLKTVDFTFFGKTPSKNKGLINKMLENNKNRTIWIINHDYQIDESTKRRFTFSYRFDDMPVSMLQDIAKKKIKNLKLDADTKKTLLSYFQKYTVTGSSVDNIIKVIEGMDEDNKDKMLETVKTVLEENSKLLYGKAKMRERACKNYDLSIVNSSVSASKIVKMIENSEKFAKENPDSDRGVRILFYGLSGTGKTELVRYIAEKLGKKILLKRASDILDCFVGESEQNIKRAFAEAESSGAILLFDEADSFFQDRSNASHSWEITQVNEFLTQMEEFNGIMFCTTNLRTIMDPAMQRRFHQLVEFKALTKDGISTLLEKYFAQMSFTPEQIEKLDSYNSATPGDFASLWSRFRFMDEGERTPEHIINELETLQKEKRKNVYSKAAIGF